MHRTTLLSASIFSLCLLLSACNKHPETPAPGAAGNDAAAAPEAPTTPGTPPAP